MIPVSLAGMPRRRPVSAAASSSPTSTAPPAPSSMAAALIPTSSPSATACKSGRTAFSSMGTRSTACPMPPAAPSAPTTDQLGLRPHIHKSISYLSGGQRKRVSVGVELLAKPAILYLDEPTSGLDPATEFQLMELLRDLADTGCTIVCTTHVMENAYLMDQLIVLVGGCLAFQGSAQGTREYFGVPKLTGLYDRLADRLPKDWQSAFLERPAPPEDASLPAANLTRPQKPARRALALPILLARQWAILRSD